MRKGQRFLPGAGWRYQRKCYNTVVRYIGCLRSLPRCEVSPGGESRCLGNGELDVLSAQDIFRLGALEYGFLQHTPLEVVHAAALMNLSCSAGAEAGMVEVSANRLIFASAGWGEFPFKK